MNPLLTPRVAILQSNYIPWKGYFDLINDVDLFVFYDDVQYTKNDWRNRNKIKSATGPIWLTVPVGDSLDRRVCDVTITDTHWAQKHWKSLKHCYARAPHFKRYGEFFKEIYLGTRWTNLSELNQRLIRLIAETFLGITTRFVDSRNYPAEGKNLDRLISLVSIVGAGTYISGPSARSYIREERFSEIGVELIYKSYEGYPQYTQRYPPFEHGVSVVDLLFNAGPDAPYFIWGWREGHILR